MISIGQMYEDRLQLPEEPTAAMRRGAIVPTGITDAVTKALPSLSGDFTHADVIQKLTRGGFKFAVKNKRHSVGRILRKFALQGKLMEVKKGVAGEFSVYRLVTS